MKKQLSELRKMIKNDGDNYNTCDLLNKLNEIENLISEPTPKNAGKFIELTDNEFTTVLRKDDISCLKFQKESFTEVEIFTIDGKTYTFNVSENEEVIENLIADFKG